MAMEFFVSFPVFFVCFALVYSDETQSTTYRPLPKDPDQLMTCNLEGFEYDCVSNPANASILCILTECPDYTDEDAIQYPCYMDDCPEHKNTSCANIDRNIPRCPKGEYCIVPEPTITQLAFDFAKCKPASKKGEPCNGSIENGEENARRLPYYIFPPCEENLFCDDASYTKGKYREVGMCV